MALLKKLKSLFGLDSGRSGDDRRDEEVGVTVERDRGEGRESAADSTSAAESEADGPPIDSGTAAGSTEEEPTGTEPEEAPPGTDAPGTETAEPAPAETGESTEEGAQVDGTVDVEPDVDAPEPGVEPEPERDPGSADADAAAGAGTEPETGAESGAAAADDSLQDIKGIGPSYADRLSGAGVETIDQLADADADDLADETGLSVKRIESWIERAKHR